MRMTLVLGIVLVLAGGYVLVHGIHYTSAHSVLQVGDFEASYAETRSVPVWLGALAIAGGAMLVVFGLRRPPRRMF